MSPPSTHGNGTSTNDSGYVAAAPGTAKATADKPAPIGTPAGAKSMPASRRTSGNAGTFGLDRLSLNVSDDAGNAKEENAAFAEGAQSECAIGGHISFLLTHANPSRIRTIPPVEHGR